MEPRDNIPGYRYRNAMLNQSHEYLLPMLNNLLDSLNLGPTQRRIFELGCGNGSVADQLTRRGFEVIGVDPSEEGVAHANKTYPHLKISRASAYDDLAGRFGCFPIVISLEVIEHVFFPRKFASAVFDLLADGGISIISTLYHGYWKNLALALTGKMDAFCLGSDLIMKKSDAI